MLFFQNPFVFEKLTNKQFFCLNQMQGAIGEDRGRQQGEEGSGGQRDVGRRRGQSRGGGQLRVNFLPFFCL